MLQISEKDRDSVVQYIFSSNPRVNTIGEVNGLINHLNNLKAIPTPKPVDTKKKKGKK
ncbi:hypothetical protein KAR91_76575 [Candidatus Pacearchaeota archaeon]|nr:hypothetical protein [Candidatus Pacearchaeota archaeon]